MSTQKMSEKSQSALKAELSLLRREQFKLRLVKARGELTNTSQIKKVRRNIARAMTLIAQEGKQR